MIHREEAPILDGIYDDGQNNYRDFKKPPVLNLD
jgi:hypothetical protein